MDIIRRILSRTIVCAAACAVAAGAGAQDYPSRPVKVIVPYAPGGSTDVTARLVMQKISAAMGQPFIIENRPGASTAIGTEQVARAPNDGYTLLATAATTFSSNPHLVPNLKYKLADFAPVGLMAWHPYVVLVSAHVPAKTIPELVTWVRSSPTVRYGTPGVGTTPHITGEIFGAELQGRLEQVPYQGEAPITRDLLGGVIDLQFAGTTTAISLKSSGKLRVIGIMGARQLPALPGVGTFPEAGFAGAQSSSWFGVFAPAGTSPSVVDALNRALNKAILDDELQRRFAADGMIAEAMTPDAFGAYVRKDAEKIGQVIQKLNIKLP